MTELQPGDFLALDGIIIRPVRGSASGRTSVVMGIIPPSPTDYSTHLHGALEQVTYVISGETTAIWRRFGDAAPTETPLKAGEAITTGPATTLSFRNTGAVDAVVLFICVPPYAQTHADARLIADGHRPLTTDEIAWCADRLESGAEHLAAQLNARSAELRWLLDD